MTEFKCTNCGMCCGPVPVTNKEFKQLRRTVKAMPRKKRERLQQQARAALTCIFLDQDTKRCGVYHARPDICRMFGLFEGLECPNNQGVELKSQAAGSARVEKYRDKVKGILSVDITWEDFK